MTLHREQTAGEGAEAQEKNKENDLVRVELLKEIVTI